MTESHQEKSREKAETVNKVQIREYSSNDFDQVRELFVQGMKVNNAPESYIERSLNTDLADIQGTYMKERGTFFVIERLCDNVIVGTVGLQDLRQDDNLCELRRMSIHESERRRGLGRQLIDYFIEYARHHKFSGIKLSTGSWMEKAMKFYVSMGFEDKGRVTYTHHDGSFQVIIANFEMLF